MRYAKWALILIAAIPLFAAAPAPQDRMLVSTDWLEKNLRYVTVLAVGASEEFYQRGHIPGALFVLLSELLIEREGIPNELPGTVDLQRTFEKLGVGDSGRIVIYGDTELAAARAFFTLDSLGYGYRSSLLDGGLAKWISEDRAISFATPVLRPRPFPFRLQRNTVASREIVEQLLGLQDQPFLEQPILIDARASQQFSGQDPGPGIERPGQIPTARNVCWTENLTGGQVPVLRPISELLQVYREVGLTADKRPIVYCRTGMEASLTYFVLRYLGYEPMLYDGSFLEWSSTAGHPVERSDIFLSPEIAWVGDQAEPGW